MYTHWTRPATLELSAAPELNRGTLTPPADVLDDGEKYELVLEMPGVTEDNLSINLEHDALVVHGTRHGYADDARVLYNGRYASRSLEKSFRIGRDVDRNQVSAKLENGLLHITLPRKAEEKTRRIEIDVK